MLLWWCISELPDVETPAESSKEGISLCVSFEWSFSSEEMQKMERIDDKLTLTAVLMHKTSRAFGLSLGKEKHERCIFVETSEG